MSWALRLKLITTPEYAGVANYAYHLDAGRFAGFIRDHCVKESRRTSHRR